MIQETTQKKPEWILSLQLKRAKNVRHECRQTFQTELNRCVDTVLIQYFFPHRMWKESGMSMSVESGANTLNSFQPIIK